MAISRYFTKNLNEDLLADYIKKHDTQLIQIYNFHKYKDGAEIKGKYMDLGPSVISDYLIRGIKPSINPDDAFKYFSAQVDKKTKTVLIKNSEESDNVIGNRTAYILHGFNLKHNILKIYEDIIHDCN